MVKSNGTAGPVKIDLAGNRALIIQLDDHLDIQLPCPHRKEWCRIQFCEGLGSLAVITNGTLTLVLPCTRAFVQNSGGETNHG
ncbi:hypothetical protein MUP79_02655 [Candidatus Bathyarchaeota archaeon]|nr:hypothetical protein [Candidatus Bathyarchaeota archaeon]